MKLLSAIPRYSLYTLIILTPLPKASVQPWAVTSIHIITLIALTAFLLERCITWNWTWIRTPLDKPILALLLLSLLSTILSVHRYTSFWSLVSLVNYIVVFYLVIHTIQTRAQWRQLVYVISGTAIFLAGFGLLKRFGVNPFPWWEYPELPQSAQRVTATFGNANHLAGYMEMTIPLLLAWAL